ncbi:MAG: protein kinase [Ktedonobacteraceae bacterium]
MASEIVCNHCGTANQPKESFCENCGAQLNVPGPSPITAPTLLNQRYRVLNELGAGGFGVVYKVQDRNLNNRLLAVKKLDLDSIAPRNQQNAISSFKQEAIMLADLIHSNLPRIYEYFVDKGNYYLVMDFIAGETLYDYLDKQNSPVLPAIEVVKMGMHLATVLDYLHTRQPAIIFRDLKPENIMVTPKNEIFLIDFGIARHFKPGQAGDTIKWATLEYAAPEQLAGKQTSAYSDIYSLGIVLHQMLSGDRPMLPHKFVPLKLVGKPQTVLACLVMRMLEIDPQQRPASAAEVMQKLQQILHELQQSTTAPNTQSQPTVLFSSHARSVPLTQAFVPKPQVPPSLPKPRIQGELCHNYTHTSKKINALAWSPDGKSLAAAGEEPDQMYIWHVFTQQAMSAYTVHTRRIQALAWSPDSQWLVSGGNDNIARVWQPVNGAQQTYTGHTRWIQALAWSPDGQQIASGSADTQVHLWEATTGQPRLVYRSHNKDIVALAFAPDGTRLASADGSGFIQVWEAASGKLLTTYNQKAVSALAWSPDSQQIASGSRESVQIWEASTGQLVITYAKHARMVTAVAWSSANGGRIASASKDQSVQIWQPQTGDTLYTYRGHTSNLNTLAWSPDGTSLASAGDSDTVHVWWTI